MSASPPAPAPPTAPSRRPALDRSLVQGIAWSGGAKWATQLLSWAVTIVVARLLRPADYGLVGMASLYLGLAALVNEFGMGAAVVTLRELLPRQVAELNSVAVAFGLASVGLSLLAAPLLASFFRSPELAPVVVAMSFTFLIGGFRTVPQALLQRDLRFRRLALIESGQALLRSACMLATAFAGWGYWALVAGAVFGEGCWTALILLARRHGFARPRLGSIRHAIRFSRHVLGARIGWYVYSHADFAVAGRRLGQAALGAYSFAWTLASLPVDKITAMVSAVTPAVFAAVQDDKAAMRRYLLRITEGLALITFPATIGLALVADRLIPLALGERWEEAIAPLRLLALYAAFRSVMPLIPQLINVTRQARFGMWMAMLSAVVLPAGFVLGVRWGTVGIASAWIVLHPLVSLPVVRRALAAIELGGLEYLRALLPAARAVALMTAGVLALRVLEPAGWSSLPRLACEVALGALVYLVALAAFERRRLESAREVARLLRA